MGTARRVYLYLVAAVALLVATIGLEILIGSLIDRASLMAGGGLAAASLFDRQETSLAVALVLVGGPIYLLHRRWIDRGWVADIDAVGDRAAPIRGFHYALVSSVALMVAAVAGFVLATRTIGSALGVSAATTGGSDVTEPLAMLVVAAPVWWTHQRRRGRDIRHDRLHGRTAAITRFGRYAWAAGGLFVLVVATSRLLEATAERLVGSAGLGADDAWRVAVVPAFAGIVVGAVIFVIHALDARAAIRDAAVIGEDDRVSRLRATYFGVVLLVAIVEGMASVTLSLTALAERSLGVAQTSGAAAIIEEVVGPLLIALPFALAGLLHWGAWRRETAGRSVVARADAERIALHLASGAGLAFLSVGGAALLGRLLEVAAGSPMNELARVEVASRGSALLVGAAAWIPAWSAIVRRRTVTPLAERRAAVSHDYLYLVVGASLLAMLPSAAFTLYRIIEALLGARALTFTTELAIPVAVIAVATVTASYHARLLVSDQRFAAATDTTPEPAMSNGRPLRAPVPVMAIPTLPPDAPALDLVLRGPVGSDLFAIADDLRTQLPAGVLLEPARLSSIARSGVPSPRTVPATVNPDAVASDLAQPAAPPEDGRVGVDG